MKGEAVQASEEVKMEEMRRRCEYHSEFDCFEVLEVQVQREHEFSREFNCSDSTHCEKIGVRGTHYGSNRRFGARDVRVTEDENEE